MLRCSFLGHREILEPGFEDRLFALFEERLEKEDTVGFYLPQIHGPFHKSCFSAILRFRASHPEREVRIFAVKSSPEERELFLETDVSEALWPHPVGHLKEREAWEKHAKRFCLKQAEVLFSYVYPELEWGLLPLLEFSREQQASILDLTSPDTRMRIEALILSLPREEREILLLYRQQRNFSSASLPFGLSPRAAAAKFHAALRKLRRAFMLQDKA